MQDSVVSSAGTDGGSSRGMSLVRLFFGLLCFTSFLINLFFCVVFNAFFRANPQEQNLTERFVSGQESSAYKVALIQIDGILMEGMTKYAWKQMEQAAQDPNVKAIVVRVNSPGGTITASEELHKQLIQLRDGTSPRFPNLAPRKMVASLGAIAASGGYYVAMPAEAILAEKTTLTGSIGVYASLPNISELAQKYGVKMELIKAGGIKASGSPFHPLTPQERQPWQDMVDAAYDHFLDIVHSGRPNLTKEQLRQEVLFPKEIFVRDEKGNLVFESWLWPKITHSVRYRADGGTFTADQALQIGLVDKIGDADDAAKLAAQLSQLPDYKLVAYDRPPSFWNDLIGVRTNQSLDAQKVAEQMTPKLWYLSSHADLAGWLALLKRD